MGSIQYTSTIPTLTSLERIGPKGYLRYVFLFPLADDYTIDEVASVLKAGYNATKQRLSVLTCEAVPDVDSKQAGVSKLQRMNDVDIEDVVVNDLRGQADFPSSYAELKFKAFPVASFDADTLCRRSVWPSPGERLPISRAGQFHPWRTDSDVVPSTHGWGRKVILYLDEGLGGKVPSYTGSGNPRARLPSHGHLV